MITDDYGYECTETRKLPLGIRAGDGVPARAQRCQVRVDGGGQ